MVRSLYGQVLHHMLLGTVHTLETQHWIKPFRAQVHPCQPCASISSVLSSPAKEVAWRASEIAVLHVQAVAAVEEKKSAKTQREPSQYDLYTFTTWLLRVRFCKPLSSPCHHQL